MHHHDATQQAQPDRPGWPIDAAVVAILLGLWLVGLTAPVLRTRPIAHDTYRDAASAEHMAVGRWSDDPALLGYSYWYAPLGPLVCSLIVRITGALALNVYATSVLWLNVWILPALYLVVARSFDRLTGITAVLCVCLGSRWWSDNLALPIPAVQGLLAVLLTLLAWARARGGKPHWAILTGVLLAACTWHHVLCGLVTAAAIGGHALMVILGPRPRPVAAMLLRTAVVAAVCAILVSPLAWHLASLPRVNLVPPTWTAGELFDARYALHLAAPLILPLAVAGVWITWRHGRDRGGWVIAYLAIGLVGQAPAYANHWAGLDLPVLLPHEFQWHGQLATGILAAVATVHVARFAVRSADRRLHPATAPAQTDPTRQTHPATGHPHTDPASRPRPAPQQPRPLATGWAWACLIAIVLAPAAPGAIRTIDDRWISSTPSPARREAADWIKRHTDVYDVFLCDPDTGYRVIGALTGRKLVAPLPGYANLAAPVPDLHDLNDRLLETNDPAEFASLAARTHLRYIFADAPLHHRLPHWRTWPLFDGPFTTPDQTITILRLRPAPSPRSPTAKPRIPRDSPSTAARRPTCGEGS